MFGFRLTMIIVPLVITVPLAYMGYGYWSLIVGHIIAQFLMALMVSCYSKIKLEFYYNFRQLKEMLSFSIWTLVESISIWLTGWIDIFIVSSFFSAYYTGIYRMSMVAVNGLLAVVSGAVFPVLYSALSRLQNDDYEFKRMFYHILNRTALLVIPLGVGLFAYRDVARKILFGDNWIDADLMIGLWAITSCLAIIYCHFCSELYRAKGSPRVSFLAQVAHMLFLIPIMYYFSNNFIELTYARNLVRLQLVAVHFLIIYFIFNISPLNIIRGNFYYIFAACTMGLFALYSRAYFENYMYDYLSIVLCIIIYFGLLILNKSQRGIISEILKQRSLY